MRDEPVGEIGIVDIICPLPGHLGAYREDYLQRYAPEAAARGMTYRGGWVSPATVSRRDEDLLIFLWSVPDVRAWWRMRFADVEAKENWWAYSDTRTQWRRRRLIVEWRDQQPDLATSAFPDHLRPGS